MEAMSLTGIECSAIFTTCSISLLLLLLLW